MKCKECGREPMNPEANFCDYCGSSFRQFGANGWSEAKEEIPKAKNDAFSAFSGPESGNDGSYGQRGGYPQYGQRPGNQNLGNGEEKPVTALTFLLPFLLLLIPGIGFFATIGFMIFWLVSSQSGKIRKAYAKAVLVILAVFFFLAMLEVYRMLQDGTFNQLLQEMGLTY